MSRLRRRSPHPPAMNRRFASDRRGTVAVAFAITIVPIILLVGASVDYARLVGAKSRIEAAVDQALLAVMPSYASGRITDAMRSQATQQITAANLGSNASSTLTAGANNQLCLKASVTVPLMFARSLLGGGVIGASSCAVNQPTFEIALALDNTGSMAESAGGQSKLQALQAAATSLVQAMNPNTASPNAAIAVVPFSGTVNVDAQHYTNGAAWLDRSGQSSIHWQNYTRAHESEWRPLSRFALFGTMSASWGGCVEERPSPYLTTDTAATSSNPDTLFVPYLAPDEAGGASGAACYSFTPSSQYPATVASPNCRYFSVNSYLEDNGGACQWSEGDEAADIADPISHGSGASKICKYRGQSVANVTSGITGVNGGAGAFPAGPNLGCIATPVQPLTTDMTKITGGTGILDRMTPNGDTNLLAGFMWAWRTISPNGPFASGVASGLGQQAPKGYGLPGNTKIIVFMTDGFNHWAANPYSPYQSAYTSLGYFVNNRVSSYGGAPTNSTNYRAQMDAAFLEACRNAKASGVQIYTVGFSVPSNPIDTSGIAALQSCATSADNAYIAQDSATIIATFQTIAANIRGKRLTY
jgi:Flp pilus assembly protein TadG